MSVSVILNTSPYCASVHQILLCNISTFLQAATSLTLSLNDAHYTPNCSLKLTYIALHFASLYMLVKITHSPLCWTTYLLSIMRLTPSWKENETIMPNYSTAVTGVSGYIFTNTTATVKSIPLPHCSFIDDENEPV